MGFIEGAAPEKGVLVENGGETPENEAKFETTTEEVTLTGIAKCVVGLTEEQLKQYKNDSFWAPFRIILFVAFWLAWIAMFGAAILIVVLSPKCAAKQAPEWWQTKIAYQLLTPTFYDSNGDGVGDFQGIVEKIDELRKIGITTIYPSQVVMTDKDELFGAADVIDLRQVDPRFGSEDDFRKLIHAVHYRDMHLVMDLPIATVSPKHRWLQDKSKEKFFYVIGKGHAAFNSPSYAALPGQPDKKYLTATAGGAQTKDAVLNYHNPEVRDYVKGTIKHYVKLGVDGFHLDGVALLALHETNGAEHDLAVETLRTLTADVQQEILGDDELAQKTIVFFSGLRDIEAVHVSARESGALHHVIDVSFASLSAASCSNGVAKCVHDTLEKAFSNGQASKFTPFWQFSTPDSSRLASRFDAPTAQLLTFAQLTLPGAVLVYYGQELGLKDVPNSSIGQRNTMQWTAKGDDHHGFVSPAADIKDLFFPEHLEDAADDNFAAMKANASSQLKVFQTLAKLRQRDEALIIGETAHSLLKDDVVSFARFVRGENSTANGPAYLAVLNFGTNASKVDLASFADSGILPTNRRNVQDAEISALTSGFPGFRVREKAPASLDVPGKQGILLKIKD